MPRYKPTRFFLGVGLTLALILSLALWRLGLAAFYAYLGGINLATLMFYGYDKWQARAGGMRIPEVVLHGAALLGGTPGAIAGEVLFRHKTRKRNFRIAFAAIVVLQIGVVLAYLHFVRGR
jgi:uncharacterized membrane protein YsdA (DUF1294 family)